MKMTTIKKINDKNILGAVKALKTGDLVCFPTETVYGLGADATNNLAVAKIFNAKNRPSFNPIIVHVSSKDIVERFGVLTSLSEKIIDTFCPGPLTIILERKKDSGLSDLLSAGLKTTAFRIPDNTVAIKLLKIFNKPIDQIDNNLRRKAKTINYGIIYGISAFGLSKQLNISRSDADFFLKEYFKKYTGILNYINETTNFCKKNGFVKTLFGRKCYIDGINNKNPNFRNFAIRAAINAPIQGSAADIIKKAMINIDKFLEEKKTKSKMILQVLDQTACQHT